MILGETECHRKRFTEEREALSSMIPSGKRAQLKYIMSAEYRCR